MTLDELAIKYGTDKSSLVHNYCGFYEQTLPKQPLRVLEIGCYKGASIRMWREYFPDAEIHSLDLFEENQPPTDIPGIIYHKGNQCDYIMLDKLRHFNFDCIIDDGSHNSRDQMITFFGLMHRGCSYYIEDTHCCLEDFYRQGLPYHFTAAGVFHEFIGVPCSIQESKNIILIKC